MNGEEAISAAEERFERARRTTGLIAGPAIAVLLLLLPPAGLPPPAARLSAVMALCVVFWLTEAIPLAATALLGPALAVFLGIAPAREVFASFGDPLLFLFIGSFLIAAAMARHRLDRRLAFRVLTWRVVGASPARILVAFGILSAALSMWISNTATTAMMLPVALGVLRVLDSGDHPRRRRSSYATGLVLAVAFGASVGGIATPVGTPPNLIGIGMIERLAGRKIPFFEWTTLAAPVALLVLPLILGTLLLLHRRPAGMRAGATEYLGARYRDLGPVGRGEMIVAAVFLLVVVLWILPGLASLLLGADSAIAQALDRRIPEGPAALVAASLLFMIPVDWKRREFAIDWRLAAGIDWGTVMLFGGGMSLGSLMFTTGLAERVGQAVIGESGAWSPAAFLALSILTAILVSEAASNTASANLVLPVVIALAVQQGIDPIPPALGACLGASFGFALPVSTPPNALAYGTGCVPILRMLRAGLLLDLLGGLMIWLVLATLWS